MPPSQLAVGGASVLAGLLLYVAVFVVAWRRRPWPDGLVATAVMVATIGLVVRLPYQTLSLATLDPAPLLDELAPAMVALMSKRVVAVAWVSTVASACLTWLVHVAAVGVAQVVRGERAAYASRMQGHQLGWAAAVGIAVGGVLLLTQPDPDISLHPALATSTWQRSLWAVSRGLGAAVGGELLWRGVVQGALVQRLGPIAGIAGATALAAVPSLVGPDAAWQLPAALATGAVFGTLAFRHSLTSSTLAHAVAVTLAAVPLALEAP